MSLDCRSGNTFHEFIRPNRAIALFCCFPFVVKKFFLTDETYIRSGLCVFYIRRQTALFNQTIRFRTYVVIILRPRIVRTDFLRYILLNTIITVIFTFFRTLIKQVQTHIFPRWFDFRLLRSAFSVFKKWFFKFSWAKWHQEHFRLNSYSNPSLSRWGVSLGAYNVVARKNNRSSGRLTRGTEQPKNFVIHAV